MSEIRSAESVADDRQGSQRSELVVLAPWLGTQNMGDEIIGDSFLRSLPPDVRVRLVPTQVPPTKMESGRVASSSTALVVGTNLLSSTMWRHSQWNVSLDLAREYRNRLQCLGVGWWQYQSDPRGYSKLLLTKILDGDVIHSVRDSYTQKKMESLGLESVNTGCPSLWHVPDRLAEYDSSLAVVTITDYKDLDNGPWLNAVRERFDRVILQAQNSKDLISGIRTWGFSPRDVMPAFLDVYDKMLTELRPTYVGTRLHGGIRAMQHGLPAAFIPVDNRAREMGRDFSLPVIESLDAMGVDAALEQAFSGFPDVLSVARDLGFGFLGDIVKGASPP